jgi:hypothetical protein
MEPWGIFYLSLEESTPLEGLSHHLKDQFAPLKRKLTFWRAFGGQHGSLGQNLPFLRTHLY